MPAMTFAVFSIGTMLVDNGMAADVSNDLRNPLHSPSFVKMMSAIDVISHAPLNHDPNWNNASRHRHG